VFLGSYNRNTTISGSEFSWIGDSAMAAWGETSAALNANGSKVFDGGVKYGPDGRAGLQPHLTQVTGNLVREIGLWQKQSSAWFQAVTARTNFSGNVVRFLERF
jgi:hypothetical protein